MAAQQLQIFINAIAAFTAANPTIPVVAAPFALLPGAANRNVLDWNKAEAMKLFHKATSPLDTKFGFDEGALRTFLEQVREKARIYCWDTLLTVPDDDTVGRHLITHYGMLTLGNCRDHAEVHMAIALAVAATRMTQDSMMLYQFLLASLIEAAKLVVLSDKDSYYVNEKPSGVCFLKVIIGRSSIDPNAKTNMLRKRIAKLSESMRLEFKGNVRDFNVYVSEQRDQLLGRGQTVEELITHLFEAYTTGVPDEEFRRYIETYQNKYDDGDVIEPDMLMRKALNKYDIIMQRKEGGNEEPRVLAVSSETKDPNQRLMDFIIYLQDPDKFPQANTVTKSTPPKAAKPFVKRFPEWKKVAPKDSEPSVKTMNGKTFNWCKNHQAWTIHTEAECTYKKDVNAASKAKPQPERKNEDPKLVLNNALMAFMNMDAEE